MTFNHRPLTTIEIPERFKPILEKIAHKLDRKDIFESDLTAFLDQYDQDIKNDLISWLKEQ